MPNHKIAVLGATSLVGESLLASLRSGTEEVFAFSRSSVPSQEKRFQNISWFTLDSDLYALPDNIVYFISLAPVWVLPDYFPLMQRLGVRRLVVLSSTSLFTKEDSEDHSDRSVSLRLKAGEEKLKAWAEAHGVKWTIIRPTLIYGGGKDKNISSIASLVQKFGTFPLLGRAAGLRQPVHRDDVAMACLAALRCPQAINKAYNIAGGEVVTYREMVSRVFAALEKRPRYLSIPLFLFKYGLFVLRAIPGYRHLTMGMIDRMNKDMVFDYSQASRDFGYTPRPFALSRADLPSVL